VTTPAFGLPSFSRRGNLLPVIHSHLHRPRLQLYPTKIVCCLQTVQGGTTKQFSVPFRGVERTTPRDGQGKRCGAS
jgi:hypothetical protein